MPTLLGSLTPGRLLPSPRSQPPGPFGLLVGDSVVIGFVCLLLGNALRTRSRSLRAVPRWLLVAEAFHQHEDNYHDLPIRAAWFGTNYGGGFVGGNGGH